MAFNYAYGVAYYKTCYIANKFKFIIFIMIQIVNISLLLFGFIATLIAFFGDTLKKNDGITKITKRGVVSLTCLFLSLILGVYRETITKRNSESEKAKKLELETHIKKTSEELRDANETIASLKDDLEAIPRRIDDEFIELPPHTETALSTTMIGGDRLEYYLRQRKIYLKTSFDTYELNPHLTSIIIAGRPDVRMKVTIENRSNQICKMKTSIYSIVSRKKNDIRNN
jgi:hypothetical protein